MTSWDRTGNINVGGGRAEDTKILLFLIVHVIKNSLVVPLIKSFGPAQKGIFIWNIPQKNSPKFHQMFNLFLVLCFLVMYNKFPPEIIILYRNMISNTELSYRLPCQQRN